jgi:non-lysosomal glucosylceramidase
MTDSIAKTGKMKVNRRGFLKQAAGAIGAATQTVAWSAGAVAVGEGTVPAEAQPRRDFDYPRRFTGSQLKMISFPLGGVAAGSLGLGGRGQLVDWEIFNRPNKGHRPTYAFPSIWVQSGNSKPVAHVLEARILPPYEGQDGLGSDNVPGLSRLEGAVFTGAYPLAHIDFEDRALPVKVELDAISPFIPHDADDSGLPVAILRYRVTNPGPAAATVSIAFSIDNPVRGHAAGADHARPEEEERVNEYRSAQGLAGLVMTNPALAAKDPNNPMVGSFVVAAVAGAGSVTHWNGWPKGRWWNSPLLFWDQFSKDGTLGDQPDAQSMVGALCLQQTIAAGQSASFTFVLGWHFPNRTPEWCGWSAPKDEGKTVIGNFYSARFKDAWEAVSYAAKNLESLEERTRLFANAFAESTLPAEVKDAASANLSTLASTTCFRTADGEFHGFEGSDDYSGCCFGNCLHVWNYETVTPFLFPSFARSLRKSAFGYSMDNAGAMQFRQYLPEGKARSGYAAADGQMGQIIHAWMDWKLSGDEAWLKEIWPRVKKGLEFAWVPGGWDSNRDGVLEGVQHNTYDVEFYGPNPMCGIYYLGALRAGEEMARAVGDTSSAQEYRRLFEKGRDWIDANLFNGEFYIQKIRGFRKDEIAPNLRSNMGAENTEQPEYQVGAGCMIDQLVGQYLGEVVGLGPLVAPEKIRKTLRSIYQYNYKRTLVNHDSMARTYVLNDEAAIVICDYGNAERPRIPFPYYAEAWTGLEYTTASLMMHWDMVDEGIECVRNIRTRYDGEKRNPWDEPECGHHYARAMSSWSTVVALSGFLHDGATGAVIAAPRVAHEDFQCFWATATGWGSFTCLRRAKGTNFAIKVLAGSLRCSSFEILASGNAAHVQVDGKVIASDVKQADGRVMVKLSESQLLTTESELRIEVPA